MLTKRYFYPASLLTLALSAVMVSEQTVNAQTVDHPDYQASPTVDYGAGRYNLASHDKNGNLYINTYAPETHVTHTPTVSTEHVDTDKTVVTRPLEPIQPIKSPENAEKPHVKPQKPIQKPSKQPTIVEIPSVDPQESVKPSMKPIVKPQETIKPQETLKPTVKPTDSVKPSTNDRTAVPNIILSDDFIQNLKAYHDNPTPERGEYLDVIGAELVKQNLAQLQIPDAEFSRMVDIQHLTDAEQRELTAFAASVTNAMREAFGQSNRVYVNQDAQNLLNRHIKDLKAKNFTAVAHDMDGLRQNYTNPETGYRSGFSENLAFDQSMTQYNYRDRITNRISGREGEDPFLDKGWQAGSVQSMGVLKHYIFRDHLAFVLVDNHSDWGHAFATLGMTIDSQQTLSMGYDHLNRIHYHYLPVSTADESSKYDFLSLLDIQNPSPVLPADAWVNG